MPVMTRRVNRNVRNHPGPPRTRRGRRRPPSSAGVGRVAGADAEAGPELFGLLLEGLLARDALADLGAELLRLRALGGEGAGLEDGDLGAEVAEVAVALEELGPGLVIVAGWFRAGLDAGSRAAFGGRLAGGADQLRARLA